MKHLALLDRVPTWVRVLLLIYLVWLVILYLAQDRLLFFPQLAGPGLDHPWAGTVVLHRTIPGGSVEAWYVPAKHQHAPLVVLFHGNGSRIEDLEWQVQGYRRLGCAVLLPEYRGYGRSAGKPSQAGIVDDAVWFIEQVVARPEVDPRRIVYHGTSLGGGVAAATAARRPPAALILQSSFTSVAVMAHQYAAPAWLVRNPFHTDQVLARLDAPVLILHGTQDTMVPIAHGRRLAKLARHAKLVEFPAGHYNLPPPAWEGRYWAAIRQFLADSGMLHPR